MGFYFLWIRGGKNFTAGLAGKSVEGKKSRENVLCAPYSHFPAGILQFPSTLSRFLPFQPFLQGSGSWEGEKLQLWD